MPPLHCASPVHIPLEEGYHKYCGIVAASNGRLYCAPLYSASLLEIDPVTFKISEIALPNYVSRQGPANSCIAEGSDGLLYVSPDGLEWEEIRADMRPETARGDLLSHVLAFDPFSKETTFLHGPLIDSYLFWGIARAPNGNIYCPPSEGDEILVIDPSRQTLYTITGAGNGKRWSGVAHGNDGWLFCSPADAGYVLAINSNDDTLHCIYNEEVMKRCGWQDRWEYFEEYEEHPLTYSCFSGIAAAPNGKLYCCPQDSPQVLVIDPVSWTLQAFGSLGAEENKWSGITLAKDGRLYCAPWRHAAILMIDPTFHSCAFIDVPCWDAANGMNADRSWTGGCVTAFEDRLWFAPYGSTHGASSVVTMLLPRPDMSELRASGCGFDLVLESDENVRLQGHRCVLMAASRVFRRMLQGELFAEGRTSTIRIQGASTASVTQLVEYCYSGLLPRDADCVELAGLARAYELDLLLALCLERLVEQIAPENVLGTVRALKLHREATPEGAFWWRACTQLVMSSQSLCPALMESI